MPAARILLSWGVMARPIKFAFLLSLSAAPIWAQQVVAARSGLVHHVEGDANIDRTPVQIKRGQFPELKEGQTFETAEGRAELLLNPGVFLRLDNHASVLMISNPLADTRIEVVRGLAMLEVEDLVKGNQLSIRVGEASLEPLKRGLYEIDGDARIVRVFDGKARATLHGTSIELGRGRQTSLDPVLHSTKFNVRDTDALYAWSSGRSALIAQANLNVARSMSGGYRGGSVWAWYPGLGIYTYLPASGMLYSPFGWGLYSPAVVHAWYFPVYRGYSNGSPSGGSWTSRPATSSGSRSATSAARTGSIGRSSGVPVSGGSRGGGARGR
jgi:hypothetical protein